MKWQAWLLLLISFQVLALRDPFYRSSEYQIPVVEKTLSAGVIGDGQCWQIWHKTEKQGWQRIWLEMCPKRMVEKNFEAYLLQLWRRQVFLSQDADASLSQGDAFSPILLNNQVKVEQCEPTQVIHAMRWVRGEGAAAKGCH